MEMNTTSEGLIIDEAVHEQIVEVFNDEMIRSGYDKIVIALVGAGFFLVLVLQTGFYLTAGFCMGLQRVGDNFLTFRVRVGILAFSSTLPVFVAALIGLWAPTLHIVVFYFAVIVIGFRRNKQV
jgi:hypothetical protein